MSEVIILLFKINIFQNRQNFDPLSNGKKRSNPKGYIIKEDKLEKENEFLQKRSCSSNVYQTRVFELPSNLESINNFIQVRI